MSTVLVVDDEPSIRIVLRTALEARDYQVQVAEDGRIALDIVAQDVPDLIILDWMMPGISGLEVCQRLRVNPHTAHVPIIFLTAIDSVDRKVVGLESGADDYVTKPFDPRELLARVGLQIRKATERGQVNPLTMLPGNNLIEREISARLAVPNLAFALLYFDLDHFKAYNDYFGFSWGDQLIKALGDAIQDAVTLYGGEDKFIGHIGGDDFVAITAAERVDLVCQKVISAFDSSAAQLWDEASTADSFEAVDRSGVITRFGRPTLSIGVVTNQHRSFGSYIELGQVAAQVKKAAKKKQKGSTYFIDRRQDFAAVRAEV